MRQDFYYANVVRISSDGTIGVLKESWYAPGFFPIEKHLAPLQMVNAIIADSPGRGLPPADFYHMTAEGSMNFSLDKDVLKVDILFKCSGWEPAKHEIMGMVTETPKRYTKVEVNFPKE